MPLRPRTARVVYNHLIYESRISDLLYKVIRKLLLLMGHSLLTRFHDKTMLRNTECFQSRLENVLYQGNSGGQLVSAVRIHGKCTIVRDIIPSRHSLDIIQEAIRQVVSLLCSHRNPGSSVTYNPASASTLIPNTRSCLAPPSIGYPYQRHCRGVG